MLAKNKRGKSVPIIVRKQLFKAVVVPHLPKAEPIKKAEPELRKRESHCGTTA